MGILSAHWLEGRNLNITKNFSHTCGESCRTIIKVFEDFKFVQELREEIEKLKILPTKDTFYLDFWLNKQRQEK